MKYLLLVAWLHSQVIYDFTFKSYFHIFRTDSVTENEDSQDSMAEDIGTTPARLALFLFGFFFFFFLY